MNQSFSAAFLPTLADPLAISGCDVVVTDVLRASTTIISALANGAGRILPVPEIQAGIELKIQLGPDAILGGERKGVIIPGYDQGNSPREYTRELVGGDSGRSHPVGGPRPIVLCTSNGTVAMESCRTANRVLIGAFVNLAAIAAALRNSPRVTVVCAGTDRRITSEDILLAGALAERLGHSMESATLDDSARVALGWWQAAREQMAGGTTLAAILGGSAGGRNLLKLNYDEDVRFCAQIDSLPVIPQLDLQNWEIRLAHPAPGTGELLF